MNTTATPSTAVPAAVFSHTCPVRFSHCDPAGIVFFPQYFVMLNGVVEDWFTQALGIDYHHFIGQRRLGLPTVSLHCDFVAPSFMGDSITFQLHVERVGKRSITLNIACVGADGPRLQMRQVLVTTSLAEHGSIDIPPDVLEAITRWQSQPGATP